VTSMTLTDDQVETLKLVLQEICHEHACVTRADIFKRFEKRAKSGIEQYRFNRGLSKLIREERIVGYEIRQGRHGGIIKTEPIERVTITCSTGKYVGCIPQSKLSSLLRSLKRN
jgi:hypothetical protein